MAGSWCRCQSTRYYVGYTLDGRAMSTDGFTIELGLYYSISEGVKGNEERATKTTKTTTTTRSMTKTEMASLLPPLGWNTIEYVIGDIGHNNVDSWAFLRAGLFSCITMGRGVDGRATMT
jgi:hypothetical protein